MSVSLIEVYNRLKEKKGRRKDMTKMFQDELAVNARYQEILEEMNKLREEKKAIETQVRAGADLAEYENLKLDIKGENELLADIALNMYVAQEAVEIVDDYNARWVPVFAVRFKKD